MEKTKLTFKEIIKLFEIEDSKHKVENDKIIPTKDFINLEGLVCQKCSPEQIYKIAKLGLKSTNIQKLGQVIIDSKDPEWNFYFARDIKGADVLAHGQVVIASKDPELNYLFARDVKGADILAHAQILYEENQYYFEQLIKELKKIGISFEYDENGKPVKVLSRLDQIIENFDDIEIE